MTSYFEEHGYTQDGIDNFIAVIESILPYMPGNWQFIGENEKLRFIYNNKETIFKSIEKALPDLPDFGFFKTGNDNLYKRYSALSAARSTLISLTHPDNIDYKRELSISDNIIAMQNNK